MLEHEFPIMRRAGALLAEVLAVLRERVAVGATGLELDAIAEEEILRRKCRPAFKGYRGYPRTLCVSVNERVVHGIPDARPFQDGDVVSVDAGLSFGGYHADAAFTVVLEGRDVRRAFLAGLLASAVRDAFDAGLGAIRPGARVGDVGAAIQAVADARGFGVVRDLVGHGIGRELHEPPSVPNFGKAGRGALLTPGTAIAIEPMFTMGGHEVDELDDGWTIVTRDGSLAAHHEHTVLITEAGAEVLTRPPT